MDLYRKQGSADQLMTNPTEFVPAIPSINASFWYVVQGFWYGAGGFTVQGDPSVFESS